MTVTDVLTHPAGTPVRVALAGADRYAVTSPRAVLNAVHLTLDQHETAESPPAPGSLDSFQPDPSHRSTTAP